MKKILFVAPLMAISLIGCNKGGGDKPITDVTYNVKFNITDCSVTYEGNKVGTDGVDIKVPQGINPYYVKFSVKASESVYKKPSNVTLDKTTDYTFDKDSGDLLINLQSNLNVTGACDMYKSLEECTWSQIKTISQAETPADAFHVGEEKTVTLLENGVEQNFKHTVRIIGFSHDKDPEEGWDIGITFEFKNVITKGTTTPTDAYTTIWDDENNNDYRNSTLNDALNNKTEGFDSVINRLPNDLKEVIIPVDKKVGVGSYGSFTATSFDGDDYPYPYLFALAYDEMLNHDDSVTDGEGSIYQYYRERYGSFKNIKRKVGSETEVLGEDYWFRSPHTADNIEGWCCDHMGSSLPGEIKSVYAVAPAFCI